MKRLGDGTGFTIILRDVCDVEMKCDFVMEFSNLI